MTFRHSVIVAFSSIIIFTMAEILRKLASEITHRLEMQVICLCFCQGCVHCRTQVLKVPSYSLCTCEP